MATTNLPYTPSDGKQERSPDHETQQSPERASTQQPVIHDDQPADAHHGSPTESEIVDGAKLAGESVHEVGMVFTERANYKTKGGIRLPPSGLRFLC